MTYFRPQGRSVMYVEYTASRKSAGLIPGTARHPAETHHYSKNAFATEGLLVQKHYGIINWQSEVSVVTWQETFTITPDAIAKAVRSTIAGKYHTGKGRNVSDSSRVA